MVTIQNIINQVVGDDITILATVKSADGSILDVSGSTSTITVKESYTDQDSAAISQTQGTLVTDGTDGKIEFNVPHTDTENVDPTKTYVYDAQVELSNGRKYTILRGELTFLQQVTQA